MSQCGFTTVRVATLLALATAASAQDPLARPYDGIQAGLDAFRLAEEKRHANVAGQLGLNQQLLYWPAFSYGGPVVGAPYGFPLSTYGYLARQSIGQQQSQTGPNRWESHPVYDPTLTPYLPLPPVDSPWLDGTAYAPARQILPAAPAPATAPAPAAPPTPATGRRLIDAVERPQASEPIPPPPPQPVPPRSGPREY